MKFKDFYQHRPVLITGGCGFIGSHLAEQLVHLGAQVTIIDDLSSGSLDNIAAIKDTITFVQVSIEDQEICNAVVKNQSIIFHLAAFISVPQSVEQPQQCHTININGTLNLLEAAREHRVQRFVFSSSCAVYGTSDQLLHEELPCNPISPYGLSKLIGEQYCRLYAQIYNLETVMLRYFNVYGPRQNPHAQYAAAVAQFTYRMKNNLPLIVHGDGKQTRDFISVNEVVEANLLAGCAQSELVSGKIFNIATGYSMSVLELIQHLKEQFSSYQGELQFTPARPGDVKHVNGSCNRFKKLREAAFAST